MWEARIPLRKVRQRVTPSLKRFPPRTLSSGRAFVPKRLCRAGMLGVHASRHGHSEYRGKLVEQFYPSGSSRDFAGHQLDRAPGTKSSCQRGKGPAQPGHLLQVNSAVCPARFLCLGPYPSHADPEFSSAPVTMESNEKCPSYRRRNELNRLLNPAAHAANEKRIAPPHVEYQQVHSRTSRPTLRSS
jgi:hypothetical protein